MGLQAVSAEFLPSAGQQPWSYNPFPERSSFCTTRDGVIRDEEKKTFLKILDQLSIDGDLKARLLAPIQK